MNRLIRVHLPRSLLLLLVLWSMGDMLLNWLEQELNHPQPFIYSTYPELPQLPQSEESSAR